MATTSATAPTQRIGEQLLCGACQKQLSTGARFCRECGTPVLQVTSAQAQVSAPVYYQHPRSRRYITLFGLLKALRNIVYATIMLFLVAVIAGVVLFFVHAPFREYVVGLITPAPIAEITKPAETKVEPKEPPVIEQVQALGRYEGRRYGIRDVIEGKVARGNALDYILGDNLIIRVVGEIIVGVDLSTLTEATDPNNMLPGQVWVSEDRTSIKITLPPSIVMNQAVLDNARTRVIDRQKQIITGIGDAIFGDNEQSAQLESTIRAQGDQYLLGAACEDGAMAGGAADAKSKLEQFLTLLKFVNITIIESAGSCVLPDGRTPLYASAQP